MKRPVPNRLIMIAVCSGFIGLLLLPLSLSAHDKCDVCHLSQTPARQNAELAGELPVLCINCHFERAGNGEHAINVIPVKMTGNLPLVNGRLGCTTCHDPHGTDPMQLRTSAHQLCQSCHAL